MPTTEDLKYKILTEVVGAQALKSLSSEVSTLIGLGKIFAGTYGVSQLVGFAKSVLDTASHLGDLSSQTGISVEDLSKFKTAAEQSGLPVDSLAQNLAKLSKAMVESLSGNEKLKKSFTDSAGKLLPVRDVILKLSDQFSALKGSPEKAALSMEIFGKSGAAMIPFLDKGSKAILDFGLNIDQDFSARAANFNNTIGGISVNIQNNLVSGLTSSLPAFQEVFSAIFRGTTQIEGLDTVMVGLGEAFRLLALVVSPVATILATLVDGVLSGLYNLCLVINSAMTALVQTVYGLSKALFYLAQGDFKAAFQSIKDGVKEVGTNFEELGEKYKKTLEGLQSRTAKRFQGAGEFSQSLLNNSILFSDKSPAQVLADQKKQTAPLAPPGGSSEADLDLTKKMADSIAKFQLRIDKIKAESQAVGENKAVKEQSVFLAEVESAGILKNTEAYKKLEAGIRKYTTQLQYKNELETVKALSRKSDEEIKLQQITIDNVGLNNRALQKLILTKQIDNQTTEATIGFTEKGKLKYEQAAEQIKKQKIAQIDQQENQKEFLTVGAAQAMKAYLDNAKDTASQVNQAFGRAFQNIEDSLVDFIKKGKLDFTRFIDDLITDLIRFQVKKSLVGALEGSGLAGFFGYSSAAAAAPTGGLTAPSTGGGFGLGITPLATPSMLAGAGVSGKVAGKLSNPFEGSNVLPFNPSQKNSSQSVTVNVSVEKGQTSASFDAQSAGQLGKSISFAVRQELITQKRPGGLLS